MSGPAPCRAARAEADGRAGIQVHIIEVGRNTRTNEVANKFFPDRVIAENGTMLQFHFTGGNHTATQSNFDNALVPLSVSRPGTMGAYSGFQPANASMSRGLVSTFTVPVAGTMWFFCSQGRHGEGGMSLVVNENLQANSTRSLEAYRRLSANVAAGTTKIPGGGPMGGIAGDSPVGGENGNGNGNTGGLPPLIGAAGVSAEASIRTLLLLLGVALLL